jgi:hypothetical protein
MLGKSCSGAGKNSKQKSLLLITAPDMKGAFRQTSDSRLNRARKVEKVLPKVKLKNKVLSKVKLKEFSRE